MLLLRLRREFLAAFPELLTAPRESQMGLAYWYSLGTDVSKTFAYLGHEVCGAPKDPAYPTDDWIAERQDFLRTVEALVHRP